VRAASGVHGCERVADLRPMSVTFRRGKLTPRIDTPSMSSVTMYATPLSVRDLARRAASGAGP